MKSLFFFALRRFLCSLGIYFFLKHFQLPNVLPCAIIYNVNNPRIKLTFQPVTEELRKYLSKALAFCEYVIIFHYCFRALRQSNKIYMNKNYEEHLELNHI